MIFKNPKTNSTRLKLKGVGIGILLFYPFFSLAGSNMIPSPMNFEISVDQLDLALKQINQRLIQETLFVIPNNDGEARRAVAILTALKVPHLLESKQAWGATLDKEKLENFLTIEIRRIVIFEIPGPEIEMQLARKGYEIKIIDHHAYKGLDRRTEKSSLEQLMSFINWPANQTDMAIAINDRGYIPGLKSSGFSPEEIASVREYDLIAQGQNLNDIRQQVKLAQLLIPVLPKREGITILDNVEANEGILKQELAIREDNGLADTFEVRGTKVGFTGNPAAVKALLAFDFTTLGYDPGSYTQYGGGDPYASMFFGFKPSKAPRGFRQLVPSEVADKLLGLIIKTKKAQASSTP